MHYRPFKNENILLIFDLSLEILIFMENFSDIYINVTWENTI